jgi:mannose-1-phosphate guanylyltransferase/mannose-6-phosphate isomerase
MSRALYPKQFMPLVGERSMLQETVLRVGGGRFAAPLVVCNNDHRFIVAEQLRELSVTPHAILLEPVGRNTAPAAAIAAYTLMQADPNALMLLMPSDHVIADIAAFHAAIDVAQTAAMDGALATFGIRPTKPETGYGYIRRGEGLPASGVSDCFRVAAFVEKPDLATAERYLTSGDYYWNSGIFLFPAARYLEELERLQPDVAAACRRALAEGLRDLDFLRLDGAALGACPSLSVDYAVMEHTEKAVVVPVDMGWSDVGSWPALWEISAKDADNNVCLGDVLTREVRNSYIRADGRLVAAIGLDDVIIVVTDDAVLAAAKNKAQDVRAIVETLAARNRQEHMVHSIVYRPWGSYQTVDIGQRFQVKHITVNAGAKLSLQMHHHRAEHWIVVAGTAMVTRGDETLLVHENQSTYIPVGVRHRLENPGKVPLRVIEVQSGGYLGEDDIVRLDDAYGRS